MITAGVEVVGSCWVPLQTTQCPFGMLCPASVTKPSDSLLLYSKSSFILGIGKILTICKFCIQEHTSIVKDTQKGMEQSISEILHVRNQTLCCIQISNPFYTWISVESPNTIRYVILWNVYLAYICYPKVLPIWYVCRGVVCHHISLSFAWYMDNILFFCNHPYAIGQYWITIMV